MADAASKSAKRLVLCFDGTGNKFLGNETDTNVVKIYQMLDRTNPDQYHYYQPGIGTYENDAGANAGARHGSSIFSKTKSWLSSASDQAVGHSFVTHVLAGYRFLMRYYLPGDYIYIFGFSRGAYTARFLSEMVHEIGLLSRGNEEMVHFAWVTFSGFQTVRFNDPLRPKDLEQIEYMKTFKKTFSRPNVTVYFLGLFDCVNSVGQFEIPLFRKSFKYVPIPPATYIRHAVSINERRLKFKPALFQLDDKGKLDQDIKEVWFAGNHADIGGGWERQKHQFRLLSDIPLHWMVHEVCNLPNDDNKLAFQRTTIPKPTEKIPDPNVQLSLSNLHIKPPASQMRARTGQPHDMLALGGGVSYSATAAWWIIEVLPFFTRLELENGKWIPRYWPPNLGSARDIPTYAEIHPSVQQLHQAGVLKEYQMPKVGEDEPNLLVPSNRVDISDLPRTSPSYSFSSFDSDSRSDTGIMARSWTETDSLIPKVWKWN